MIIHDFTDFHTIPLIADLEPWPHVYRQKIRPYFWYVRYQAELYSFVEPDYAALFTSKPPRALARIARWPNPVAGILNVAFTGFPDDQHSHYTIPTEQILKDLPTWLMEQLL